VNGRLRACFKMHLRSSQSIEREPNHGQVGHSFACLSLSLVVATESAVSFSPHGQAHVFAQMRVNLLPHAIAFPESEVVIGRTPGGKVSRQVAPLATGLGGIEDRIEQLANGMFSGSPVLARLGKAINDELPFGVAKIRCVSHRKRITDCHTRYKLTLKASLGYFSNRL